ncbi:M-phase inducer phosphatase 3-like isoform X2 [Trichoplusia ni]|uniref:protein-tyrosine-phosphatase n=1 Tax=Trichoplusia ni TaxID=7111 RepID=A0A7E5X5G2_TRINI|nr:M-phase inducer phosphatase 3-like isoform X2 [Trichoplusia ni]
MIHSPILITENFKINSGNNGTKRKQEDSLTHNYKVKMNPHTIDFSKSQISPIYTPTKRRILGEIQVPKSPLDKIKSPLTSQRNHSPLSAQKYSPLPNTSKFQSPLQSFNSPLKLLMNSPLARTSPLSRESPLTTRVKRSRITKVMEERTRFKMSNKENASPFSETMLKLDVEEETRDFLFGERFEATREKVTNWSTTKLDFTHTLPKSPKQDLYVPDKEPQEVDDFESLHDLETEFEADNFDECTKYEIISTDSPDIISRGRASSSRKITSRNFVFGAPLADDEASTSFNKPTVTATRMLNFDDDDFEFTSPAIKKAAKKSLKFNETPTKLRHEKSDSSIGSLSQGSMSQSPITKGLHTFESQTSMESGFISELDEQFLEFEESNSPKVANFNDLLSGQIKSSVVTEKNFLRRPLNRSLSFNPECRARVSLLSILESPSVEKRSQKRMEQSETVVANKRRRSNCQSPEDERLQRPVLQRALSENNASIMSAMTRSLSDVPLTGDFSRACALPLTRGAHPDLKSISCDTLAALLRGDYRHTISDFQVIDCRYPYEYEGGHIQNAINLYTPAQVLTLMNAPPADRQDDNKRSILVFHCEFSLERGPKLFRFLRSSDRAKNKDLYPSLRYPEVYLLHEGYRCFYQRHPLLCSPTGYVAMLDPTHKQQLRLHRHKSNSRLLL